MMAAFPCPRGASVAGPSPRCEAEFVLRPIRHLSALRGLGRRREPRGCKACHADVYERTFRGHGCLWGAQELSRLVNCTRAAGFRAWDGIVCTRGTWSWSERGERSWRFDGRLLFQNLSKKEELFIPTARVSARALSQGSVSAVRVEAEILPRHDLSDSLEPPRDSVQRKDGYWSAFILTPGSRTSADVVVRVTSDEPQALADVEALVVDVQYGTYGRRGLSTRSQQIVLPTHFPATAVDESVPLPDAERDVLPVRTHLLSHLDDPVTVVETYASRLARPGDVVALAESAVAVMQGRFRHPANVRLGWLARSACWLFFTTSSVATAPGLQVLIDCVGTVRVFLAIAWGIVCRLLGIRGGFYRVAGVQAKTIDDVSGTVPPFDQYIVMGPERCDELCRAIRQRTGIEAVVVDANDLGKVDILGRSAGVNAEAVARALAPNPAGNGDQRTPIVVIRNAAAVQAVA